MKTNGLKMIFLKLIMLCFLNTFAQDKTAELSLSFTRTDTLNTCLAKVISENQPVADISVKLFVKRLFGLLPVGEASTNENGEVGFTVPRDIPGDSKGNIVILAKIEDDDNYQNVEFQKEINWGVSKRGAENKSLERSLASSRDRAPVYFIVVSNFLIIAIWGTIIYVVAQVFKLRRVSKIKKNL